jgi:ribosome assembly protein YihI (activator of Der GTPase)
MREMKNHIQAAKRKEDSRVGAAARPRKTRKKRKGAQPGGRSHEGVRAQRDSRLICAKEVPIPHRNE